MGAWAVGHFDNDDALDWAIELAAAPDTSAIESALRVVVERSEAYLEATEAAQALAAAEVVATLHGTGGPGLPADVDAWVARHRPADGDLAALALQAVRRVRLDSELKDLWGESDAAEDWNEAISDLEKRLIEIQ